MLLLLHVRLAWGRNGVYGRFCVSVVAIIVVVAVVVVVAVFVRGTLVSLWLVSVCHFVAVDLGDDDH